MTITFIGVLLLLIGLPVMLYGRTEAMVALLLACGVLGGSAAINLPALGGSSIPPIHFALLLAGLRILLPGSGQGRQAHAAFTANWPLAAYAALGAALAFIGPRLFRGAVMLPPLRPGIDRYIYAAELLHPTAQNLTAAIYLIGTWLCAVAIHVACSGRRGAAVLVKAGVVIAWTNIALGIVVAATQNTALADLFALFRNGSYAQLDQQYGSFVRLSGLFPEASVYATYCFGWFVFMVECWYRGVMPRRTGWAALGLLAILVASTSSSAYVSLAAYAIVWAARLLVPGSVRSAKLVVMALALLAGAMLAAVTVLLLPQAGAAFVEMVQFMTFAKGQSYSGLQRAFWARKGLEAFVVSHGMGVGPGSFRSSSLLSAILGSTGIVGALLFAAYLARVVKPLRASTYGPVPDERTGTGVAAGWAALMLMVPSSLIAASCDPGTDFAIFCGAALALRAGRAARRPAAGTPHGGAGWAHAYG